MTQSDIADVPENYRHGATRLCERSLDVVPCISISIDASCTVAVDMDLIASEY